MPDQSKLQNPCPEYLLRIACFDAYALAVENLRSDDATHCERVTEIDVAATYYRHPYHGFFHNDRRTGRPRKPIEPSQYSDDAEKAIANTRVLIAYRPAEITRLHFANAQHEEFVYGGSRSGYAGGFQALLETTHSGEELLAKLNPDSCRNGACMGVGPVGILPNVADALRVAAVQASVTHNTRCGIFCARTIALAAHYAFYHPRDERSRLREYLLDHRDLLGERFDDEKDCGHSHLFTSVIETPWDDHHGVWEGPGLPPIGLSTVQAALTLAVPAEPAHDSMIAALRRLLRMGGDTDSVAAVVAALMAPWHQDEPLPDFLVRDLECGSPKTGAFRLLGLGDTLVRKFT